MINPMNFDETPSVVFKFATGAVCLKLGPNQIATNASTDIEPGVCDLRTISVRFKTLSA